MRIVDQSPRDRWDLILATKRFLSATAINEEAIHELLSRYLKGLKIYDPVLYEQMGTWIRMHENNLVSLKAAVKEGVYLRVLSENIDDADFIENYISASRKLETDGGRFQVRVIEDVYKLTEMVTCI